MTMGLWVEFAELLIVVMCIIERRISKRKRRNTANSEVPHD